MNPWKAVKQCVKRRLVEFAIRHVNLNFKPSPKIIAQRIDFMWRNKPISIAADFKTLLYETINEIIEFDCYQLDKCKFSHDSTSVVIDVGGNVGVAALVLAQDYPGSVITIEPIEENCAAIRKNIALNSFSNVKSLQAALSDKDGHIDLWMDPHQSVLAFSRGDNANDVPGLARISVPSISLPTLLAKIGERRVDLLKMDCEGGEYAVINQIDNSLAPGSRRSRWEFTTSIRRFALSKVCNARCPV